MIIISSSYSNHIQLSPTCSVHQKGMTRRIHFSSGFTFSSVSQRNFLRACAGVRNGYDRFGLKESSNKNESPGRRFDCIFFQESKKFLGAPVFFGTFPELFWYRLFRILIKLIIIGHTEEE